MFIFEGPDNSGKSTLIESVGQRYSLNTLKKSVNSDRSAATDPGAYLDSVLSPEVVEEPWLLDRFYLISSMVYGPLLSTNGHMSDPNRPLEDPSWLSMQWRKFGLAYGSGRVFTIWCLPPFENVRDAASVDHHMDSILTMNIARIYWLYHVMAWVNTSSRPDLNYIYDYTVERPDGLESFYNWFDTTLEAHSYV